MSFFFLQIWVTGHQSHPAWVIKLQMIFRWSLSNPHPCRYIAHWRLKGMTSPKNTYSFGHLHCFNSTMYAYCLLGRPKNDRPSSQKLWPNLIFGLIGPLKLQCKTSNWWPEPIYGSIMLKICARNFLTKLHPFFTYVGKKIGPTYWIVNIQDRDRYYLGICQDLNTFLVNNPDETVASTIPSLSQFQFVFSCPLFTPWSSP